MEELPPDPAPQHDKGHGDHGDLENGVTVVQPGSKTRRTDGGQKYDFVPLITITDSKENTTVMFPDRKSATAHHRAETGRLFFNSTPTNLNEAVKAKSAVSRVRNDSDRPAASARKRSVTETLKSTQELSQLSRSHAPLGLSFVSLTDVQMNKIRDDPQLAGLSRRDLSQLGSQLQGLSEIGGSLEAGDLSRKEGGGACGCLPLSVRESLDDMLNLGILKDGR